MHLVYFCFLYLASGKGFVVGTSPILNFAALSLTLFIVQDPRYTAFTSSKNASNSTMPRVFDNMQDYCIHRLNQ